MCTKNRELTQGCSVGEVLSNVHQPGLYAPPKFPSALDIERLEADVKFEHAKFEGAVAACQQLAGQFDEVRKELAQAQAMHRDTHSLYTEVLKQLLNFEKPTEKQAKCFHDAVAGNNNHTMFDFETLWSELVRCRKGV